MKGSTSSSARFVCQPSDEVSLAFKTTRAQPRPENARPEMETFLNVPPDELEELLNVALGHMDELFKRECNPAEGHRFALALTRIEAESSARTRDIQATSTFLQEESRGTTEAFCRAASTPQRKLRAIQRGEDEWRVGAMLEADGATWGPTDCTNVIALAGAAPHAAARAARAARDAQDVEDARKRLVHGFLQLIKIGRGSAACDVATGGAWSPKAPEVVIVGLQAMPTNPAASQAMSRMSHVERCAQGIVRARGTGALQALSKDALVPPDACGVAALLESAEQDWDAAGRFPCITINVLQSNMFETPWVFLTLPDGMRWRGKPPRGKKGYQPLVRLIAEAADREALDRIQDPVALRWSTCVEKCIAQRARLPRSRADDAATRAELLRCVLDAYAACLTSPDAMVRIDSEIEDRVAAAFAEGGDAADGGSEDAGERGGEEEAVRAAGEGDGLGEGLSGLRVEGTEADASAASQGAASRDGEAGGEPDEVPAARSGLPELRRKARGNGGGPAEHPWRFEGVLSDDVTLAFETVRVEARHEGDKPAMETFLNVDEEELEELLGVALRRVWEFLGTVADDRAKVVTRFEAECWSKTRDIRAVSTLTNFEGPSVDAFCRTVSVDGRKLRARPGSDRARVHATLSENGNTYGPLDCTELVNVGRGLMQMSAQDAAVAYNDVVRDLQAERALYCFREIIPYDHGDWTCPYDVSGVLSRTLPHMIMVMVRPSEIEPASFYENCRRFKALTADSGAPEFWARLVVEALAERGALRAVSVSALLPPRNEAAKCPEQAWDGKTRFPAVSVNVALERDPAQGIVPSVWLELPRGMRWKADPVAAPSGVRRVSGTVTSENEVEGCFYFDNGLRWQDVTEFIDARVRDMAAAGDARPVAEQQRAAADVVSAAAANPAAMSALLSAGGLEARAAVLSDPRAARSALASVDMAAMVRGIGPRRAAGHAGAAQGRSGGGRGKKGKKHGRRGR
ncbi:unnamed protein product [Pedinophyceae sp. YPF-701]|nr:unnamed protein product [Pedinophyceae sp. YPF-701]